MPITPGPVNAAVPTPLGPDGHVDAASVGKLVNRLIGLGLDGAMVLGTMGEGRFLSNADRELMVEKSLEAAGDQLTIYCTVADTSRALMVERTKRYVKLGAHAIVICVPPGRPAAKAIADVKAVADASEVPCAYYDIPENTGVRFVLNEILDILTHDNIVVMKDSSGNDLIAQALPAYKPDGVSLFHGSEYRVAHTALLGYDGCLHGGGALTGKHVRMIWNAVKEGRVDEAMKMDRENTLCLATIYNRFEPLLQNLLGQKYALHLMGAMDHAFDVEGTTLPDGAKQRVQKAVEAHPWLHV